MNIPITIEDIRAERARRECIPNQFTGVKPELMRINGKYRLIVPKLAPLFTIAGICDDQEDQTEGFDFFPLKGGRGGTKSESLAHLLLEIAEEEHDTICLCTREVQNSVEESVYSYIEKWITRLGYQDHYKCIQNKIINTKTGFIFRFKGLQSSTRAEALKGLSEAKYVWCEEARTLSQKSLDMLLPSVRVDGRKLFFTYNNGKETDAVETLALYDETLTIPINIYDNPFCPEVLWKQCQSDKRIDYDKYLHIWEGQYVKDDPSRTILPFEWLEKCLNAHKHINYEPSGKIYAGVDVAEGETSKHDKNSIVIRQGAVIKHFDTWQCKNIYQSVGRVKSEYYEWGFEEVYYDAIGVGSGYASEVARIDSVENNKLPFDNIPFKGSNAVYGADSVYTRHGSKKIRNKDFFKNSKAQQWWNLRLMVQNTIKLLDGKKIDREDYFLSFDGDLTKWRDAFNELSQATFKEDGAGRKMVEKAPAVREVDDGMGNRQKVRSPNIADAIGYSFVNVFENGLRAHAEEITKSKTPVKVPRINTRAY
jgi:phage terminase large subunit